MTYCPNHTWGVLFWHKKTTTTKPCFPFISSVWVNKSTIFRTKLAKSDVSPQTMRWSEESWNQARQTGSRSSTYLFWRTCWCSYWHLHVYNADSMNLPTPAWDLFLRFAFRSCICMGCGDAATLSNDNHLLLPVQNIPPVLYVDVISFLLAKLVASVVYWVACLSVWQIKWGWCKWLNMWLMWLVCLLCCWGGSGDIRACDS